jgi:hypothetical protein
MTPVQTIRQDILNILALTGAEKIAFDTMDAGEIESAIIITEFEIAYTDRELDTTYHRSVTITAQLVAKTAEDLDALVDKLADVDDATSGKVRHAMLQRVVYETDDSPDYKVAQVTITAGISDYA